MAQAMLSPANDVREPATAAFSKAKDDNVDAFLLHLVQLTKSSNLVEVRLLCAVLLRQHVSIDSTTIAKAAPATSAAIRSTLLEMLKTEQHRGIRRKINDVISVMAARALSQGTWDELMPALIEVASNPHPVLRESVLDMLQKLAEFAMRVIREKLPLTQLKAIIMSGLTEPQHVAVRIAALKAAISVLVYCQDDERDKLADMLPNIFQVLSASLNDKDDASLQDSMEALVDLARMQPKFLRAHLKAVVEVVLAMGSNEQLDETVRCMALEFLVTLAENGKGMVRKLSSFPAQVVPLAFRFLCAFEHEDAWGTGQDDDDSEQPLFDAGAAAMFRLASALGAKLFLGVSTKIISEFVKSNSWEQKHAALVALSRFTSACLSPLASQLPMLTDMAVALSRDANPHVAWAALSLIAQFCADYPKDFQKNFHKQVMPAILHAMGPSQHARVIRQAALCLVDFCMCECPKKVMVTHMSAVLPALLALLQMNHVQVQSNALTALSAIASTVGDKFAPSYDAFMPGIKSILRSATASKQRDLRASAIEAAGILAKSVGPAKFGPEFKEVMDLFVTMLNQPMEADDPVSNNLAQACSRICACVGSQAFAPYIQHVIPPLLKSASIEDAVLLLDGEAAQIGEAELDDGYEVLNLDVRFLGKKRMAIHTSLLEEKAMACDMLCQYASDLGADFFPFVQPTAKILIPLVRYPYHEGVRLASMAALPALMEAAVKYAAKTGSDKSLAQALWNEMVKPFQEAINQETMMDALHGVLNAFADTIEFLDCPLPAEHIQTTNENMVEIVQRSLERRKTREDEAKGDDFDAEEQEKLEEENEAEDELLLYVHRVVNVMMKTCKEAYVKSFEATLFPIFVPMLAPERHAGEKEAALCILDDVIEHGGAEAVKYVEKFFPLALNYCKESHDGMRHAACYGVGVCAVAAGKAFGQQATYAAVKTLLAVINAKGSRDGDAEPATDNAISSLAKICVAQAEHLSGDGEMSLAVLLPFFLSQLPIFGDEEEALIVHRRLLTFVEGNHPALMGPHGSNLPKIFKLLAKLLTDACEEVVDEGIKARASALLQKVKSSLPAPALAQLMATLDDDEKKCVNELK